jgi:hypothetical protein
MGEQGHEPHRRETRVDALGEEYLVGPSHEEQANIAIVVHTWARYVGRIAAQEGQGLGLLLGLLDGGLEANDVLDALVMHGDLPDPAEVGNGQGHLRLIEEDAGWRHEVA